MNKVTSDVSHNTLIRTLFVVTGLLALCHIIGLFIGEYFWQWERLFRLDGESNIPTWFTSLLLAGGALVAFRCYEVTEKKDRWIWLLVAAGFLFLSCDEVATIHETAGRFFRRTLTESGHPLGFVKTYWPYVFSPLLALIAVWFMIFITRVLKNSPGALRLLIIGFSIYLLGTVVLEVVSEDFLQGDRVMWFRKATTLVEETLEMMGAIVILWGLLVHNRVLLEK